MKIFNSQALKELDLATCEAQDIDSIQLMERAAEAVSLEVISRFLPRQRIVVIAGPGNNGGDALAVARLLIEQGYKKVEVFLFNVGGKLSHDCDEERKRLITIEGVDFTEVRREFNPPYLDENDVVVDGLFGSGLRMPLQGGFKSVAQFINESGAFVVSIDVPSGLFGEWNSGAVRRDMVHADLTLSMQLPRLAFFFEENAEVIGEWKLLDIDLDKEKMREMPSDFMLMEARSIRPLVRRRDPFTAKRDYGSVLLMAGSMGMMGAAVLSARAALKSGAGLATVHSASCGMPVVQTAVPEAIFEPDRNEHFITDMTPHHNHQVIAVGPGIGTRDETVNALESLIKTTSAPLVLDADALNCIVKRPSLLQTLPPATVITPHIGEFDRLFGEEPEEFLAFYPDQQKAELSTDDTIETFLDRFGDKMEAHAEGEIPIAAPAIDYAASILADTPEMPDFGTTDDTSAMLDSFLGATPEPQKQPEPTALTESFARIMIKNHNYDKALEIIEALNLNNPEKVFTLQTKSASCGN